MKCSNLEVPYFSRIVRLGFKNLCFFKLLSRITKIHLNTTVRRILTHVFKCKYIRIEQVYARMQTNFDTFCTKKAQPRFCKLEHTFYYMCLHGSITVSAFRVPRHRFQHANYFITFPENQQTNHHFISLKTHFLNSSWIYAVLNIIFLYICITSKIYSFNIFSLKRFS